MPGMILIRITPACAGNSLRGKRAIPARWDHPRVCGEQTDEAVQMVMERGSPPRVRGTAQYYDVTNLQIRITPACAGNSSYPLPHLPR